MGWFCELLNRYGWLISTVSAYIDRGMFKDGYTNKDSSSKIVAAASYGGDKQSGGASYVVALMKPVQISESVGGAKNRKVEILQKDGLRKKGGQNSSEITLV